MSHGPVEPSTMEADPRLSSVDEARSDDPPGRSSAALGHNADDIMMTPVEEGPELTFRAILVGLGVRSIALYKSQEY